MTSSRRSMIREMEAEVRLFWTAMSDMHALVRAGVPLHAPEVLDALGEIEAIECNTDWPRLKRACIGALAVLTPLEAMAHTLVRIAA